MKRAVYMVGAVAVFIITASLLLTACSSGGIMKKTNIQKDNLTEFVTKQCGTEPAFNNLYWNEHRPGIYVDINTGEPLFSSIDKFDSGTGWPSFTKPIDNSSIHTKVDISLGLPRIEVSTNASHLGHVFDDGPNGSERYCINSAALRFIPYENLTREGYGNYTALFHYEKALFTGGCFWGVQHLLENISGVITTVAGYAGGTIENPTYEEVSTGKTGYAESVQVVFDPKIISYQELLDYFWRLHDPTQENRQGPDVGSQYRSAIFYYTEEQRQIAEQSKEEFDAKKVFNASAVTQIIPASTFYPAEEYHQDYFDKNPGLVCHSLRAR